MKHFADSEGNASGKNGNEIISGAQPPTVTSNHQSNTGFSDRLTRCFVTSSHCCQTPKSPRDQQEECYENGASASAGASYLKPTLYRVSGFALFFFWFGSDWQKYGIALVSGIDVGPTFINFGFFSRPYGLIREYIKVIWMVIYFIRHKLRPSV